MVLTCHHLMVSKVNTYVILNTMCVLNGFVRGCVFQSDLMWQL